MKLLVIYKTFNKIIDVTDKSDIEGAVEKTFKNEIRNCPFKLQYYEKHFENYVDFEFADVEDGGNIKLIVQDCMNAGKSSSDELPANTPDNSKQELSGVICDTDDDRTPGTATLAEAQQVHQEFRNSNVNVVAGHYIVQNFSGEIQKAQDINCEDLIKIVNKNTMENTPDCILSDFKHEELHEAGCVVYPQMVELDVNSYYKGRHSLESAENTSSSVVSQNESHRNQLTMKVGFYGQQQNKHDAIDVKDFMESIWQRGELGTNDVFGVTAIVASAGSGKTTLTRRMARKALDLSSTDHENENMTHDHAKIKMVHHIELKEIQEDESITLPQFLFGDLASKSEQEQVFKWLVQNQSAAIIIFDGLDQTRWDFDRKNCRKIRYDERARPSTILFNILARETLRKVKIFIASREFTVSELPLKARPERIIALNGLILEDAKTLFISLLKDKGMDLWEKIEAMSPRLLQLVCVPVFLILTAIVMGRDPNRDAPATVTELYNRIVSNLENIENIRNERILTIIKKLKGMAFRGMQEGRVLFKVIDLDRFGVTAREVEDLMSKMPGNKLVSCRLLQKDFNYFFCHQTMQEFLAASFVAEMKLDDFSRFNKEHLHDSRWSVVRRFVAGIIFSKSTITLHNVSDRTRKQKIFSLSIRSKVSHHFMGTVMELVTVIYESNDDRLMKQLSEFNPSFAKLGRDEAHVVGSLIARSSSLQSLDLDSCHINADDIQIIGKYLKARIHVLKLTTTDGDDLEFMSRGDVLNISGEGIFGHFDIKKRTLVFEWFQTFHRFTVAKFLNRLLKPDSIKINVSGQDLRRISETLRQVETLQVNLHEDRYIDWPSIEHFVKKCRVQLLDIIGDGDASNEEYVDVLKHGDEISALGVCVNIHWSFYVRNPVDVQRTLEVCKQNNIKSVRCVIDGLHRPSFGDIDSLLKHSKQLTLIYWRQDDMLKGHFSDKIQKTSGALGSEVEVLCGVNYDNSWQLGIQFQPGSTALDEYKRIGQRTRYQLTDDILKKRSARVMSQVEAFLGRSGSKDTLGGDAQKDVTDVVDDEPDHLPLQPEEDINCTTYQLIKTVNKNTKERTSVRILEYFVDDGLREPDFAVFPQLIRFDKGYHLFPYESDRNKVNDEVEFDHQQEYRDKAIKIKDFMASIWQKEEPKPSEVVDITAIVASAGSGKTTLLRRIAQEALRTSFAGQNNRWKMILYVELKDIKEDKFIKASKFLFGDVYKNDSEEDQAFEWLVKNQTDAILIIDGFDQTECITDENSFRRIGNDESSRPSNIMYNILARNILRRVKIFIASRELRVLELPSTVRPKNIIALNGLTVRDARRLFIFLLGEKGEKTWQIFDPISLRSLQLISVPVFLILSAVVLGRGQNSDRFSITVTEMYRRIISSLQNVQNIRNRKMIFSIISKLQPMALICSQAVVIYERDLKQYKVSAAEVQDVMTKVPDRRGFLFCHSSLQKFLAASFLGGMKFDVFSRIYEKDPHYPDYRDIRQFVAGIVYSKSENNLHQVSDQKKKQEFIYHSTLAQLETTKDGNARMELYAAIYETNDADLIQNLTVIDVSGIRLRRHERHIIGSLIANSGGLEYLGLWSCNVDGNNVAIITKYQKLRIRVDHIDLRENNLSAAALGSFLGFRENVSKCLDWKVVRSTRATPRSASSTRTVISRHIKLAKEGDVVKIHDEGKEFKGRFHIKESKLVLDRVYWLGDLIYSSRLFAPEFVEIPDGLLYATLGDLRSISETKIGKMHKILLDWTDLGNADWFWIEYFVRKCKVEQLEIVVGGVDFIVKYINILQNQNRLSRFGVRVNIHWAFTVDEAGAVRRMLFARQLTKMKSVRCVVAYNLELDNILTLVKNSDKLVLIYFDERHILKGEESVKFQRISRDFGSRLEVVYVRNRERDAWWLLDAK